MKKFISSFCFFLLILNYEFAQCLFENSSGNFPTYYPGCVQGSPKCVKIKFHFINNTGGAMNSPTNKEFAKLLDDINAIYSGSGLTFVTSDECIHRESIQGVSPSTLRNDLGVPATDPQYSQYIIPEDVPPYHYKNGFINIFFYQTSGFGTGGTTTRSPNFRFIHIGTDPKAIAHELGHALSLDHTSSNQLYTDSTTWECIGGDATKADRMPDTDADPFTMDIDGDKSRDNTKWYNNNCTSKSIIFQFADNCGNKNWKVPYDNYMTSEYGRECWKKFSACQISAMHYELDNNLIDYVVNCVPNLDPVCTSIVINSPTTWTNQTIVMCAKQRITITPNGTLTLINTKITKHTVNNSCPELSGNWDGIYIDSAAYGPAQYPGGPTVPSGGRLNVTQNSIIEYSDNGIQAPGSHNGIYISNSKMETNGMAIYSKGPGGLVSSGSVVITASDITSSEYSDAVLIRMDGSNLTVQSSTSITNLGGSGITGIKSYNGRLTVRNSTIMDFGVGIDKDLNGGAGIGFVLNGNHILGNLTSVRNTSSGVTATKNYFQGKIQQFGKAYGRWYANNFKKEVILDNPSLSYAFTENQFDGSRLDLSKNQSLTDARCTIWKNTGTACDGRPNSIKPSWGSSQTSSGNKHVGSMPYMGIDMGNPITHYHWDFDQFTIFTYDGTYFTGSGAISANPDCQYNLFPTEFTGGGGSSEESYNNTSNNQSWQGLNQQLSTLESQLGSTTGTALQNLINQIADVKVAIGQSVLSALQNIDPFDSTTSYNIWVSRADDIVGQQAMMTGFWNALNFSGLITYVNSLSLSGEENQDRANLLRGLDTLISFQSQAKNITQLAEEDLNVLIDIASSSFGSYTALLRAWLNIQYDIRIDPPVELNSYSRKYSKPDFCGKSDVILVPNPTSDCLELFWKGTESNVKIAISDLTGKFRFSGLGFKNSPICLKDLLGSGIYILQISSNGSSSICETKKLIIE